MVRFMGFHRGSLRAVEKVFTRPPAAVLELLSENVGQEFLMIDSTAVRVHARVVAKWPKL